MTQPIIALLAAAGVLLLALSLFWPNGGLVGRWQRYKHLTSRELAEDGLKHLYKAELKGEKPSLQSLAGALAVSADRAAHLVAEMEEGELLTCEGGEIRLTPQGREHALQVIRAHRLWERFLAEQTGYDEAEWHGQAEQREHQISAADLEALSARLGNPSHDPHGDPIPTSSGEIVPHGGVPLTALKLDQTARIVHVEDEPEAIFAQLVAEGITPGMTVRLTEIGSQRVRFWTNGDEHVLAPIVAANISVTPSPPPEVETSQAGERLTTLKIGEQAHVTHLSARCRGPERRRFLDMGILPGTEIQAELVSPSGDPVAYRIRGALIALRSEQANLIYVERDLEATG